MYDRKELVSPGGEAELRVGIYTSN